MNKLANRSLESQLSDMKNQKIQITDRRQMASVASSNDHVDLVLAELEKNIELFAKKPTRAEMQLHIRELLPKLVKIPTTLHVSVTKNVLDYMYGYGIIQPLMDDPEVSDIQVNGSEYIRYMKNGKREIFEYNFKDDDAVKDWVARKLKGTPFRFERSNARTDAFLADGSRLHVKGEVTGVQKLENGKTIVKPVTILTIRKFLGFYTVDQLCFEKQLFDERALMYLKIASQIQFGFLLSGGTGSGKTTLMNALVSETDHGKQIGILEEAPEMQPQHPFVTRYWERQANADGEGRIGTDINLKDVLRMFIDDLYVGEVRDAVMAYQFLQAANTGSGRVGTTLHAKNSRGAINRLMNLASGSPERLSSNAVWDNIRTSIHNVMQIKRFYGQRRLTELMEVNPDKDRGEAQLDPVFTIDWSGLNEQGLPDGKLQFHGLSKNFLSECAMWGIPIPKELREKDVTA